MSFGNPFVDQLRIDVHQWIHKDILRLHFLACTLSLLCQQWWLWVCFHAGLTCNLYLHFVLFADLFQCFSDFCRHFCFGWWHFMYLPLVFLFASFNDGMYLALVLSFHIFSFDDGSQSALSLPVVLVLAFHFINDFFQIIHNTYFLFKLPGDRKQQLHAGFCTL